MNETEKKAFEMLSEEKQNEVAGGEQIREDESLTETQCRKLKEAVSNLSEEEQLKIAGGTIDPRKIDREFSRRAQTIIGYGHISPYYPFKLNLDQLNKYLNQKTSTPDTEAPATENQK